MSAAFEMATVLLVGGTTVISARVTESAFGNWRENSFLLKRVASFIDAVAAWSGFDNLRHFWRLEYSGHPHRCGM